MKKFRRCFARLALVPVLALGSSCAGVHTTLKCQAVKQPICFTSFVFDADGNLVQATPDRIKAHFTHRKRFWAMLWRSQPLTNPEWDLSEKLSAELSRANGDAIVNMTITAQDDGMMFFLTYLVPIIPSCQTVTVAGDVARFDQ